MRQGLIPVLLWTWPLWLPFGVTRLTQIIMFDRLTDGPRKRVLRRLNPCNHPPGDPELSLPAYLMMCIFCMSVDIGLVLAILFAIPYAGDAAAVILFMLGIAWWVPVLDGVQGFLLERFPLDAEEMRAAMDHGGSCPEPSIDDDAEVFDAVLADLGDEELDLADLPDDGSE